MIQAIIKKDSEGTGIGGMTAKNYSMLMGLLFTYSIPLASTGGSRYYWVPKGKDYYVPALFAGEKLGDDAVPTWNLARDMYEGALGSERKEDASGPEIYYFPDKEQFLEQQGNIIKAGDTVLVKASHGMAFEEIVKALKESSTLR